MIYASLLPNTRILWGSVEDDWTYAKAVDIDGELWERASEALKAALT